MNTQKQRLLNQRIIRTKVCRVCLGRLVEKHIDGRDVVVCAEDATHKGFISETKALLLERKQQRDAVEVLANYPDLKEPEPAKESIDALFG